MRKLIFLLPLLLAGCAAKNTVVTNLPPGIPNASVTDWVSASNDLQQAQNFTHQLQASVIASQAYFPSTQAYGQALSAVAQMQSAEITFGNWLQNVPASNFSAATKSQALTFTTQLLALVQQLNSSGVTGIKNANSLNTINTFISEISSIFTLIQTFASSSGTAYIVPLHPCDPNGPPPIAGCMYVGGIHQ